MTPADFRAALKLLGMTPGSYARASGRNVNTVENWTKAKPTPVPQAVAKWLQQEVERRQAHPPP